MSHNRFDISGGWQLGWYKEIKLNKWRRLYNYWTVADHRLRGHMPNGGYMARIYANCAPEHDYDFSCTLSVPDKEGSVSIGLLFSIFRLASYNVNLRAGEQLSVHYIFSDLLDHVVLEKAGPVLEAGREYKFRAEIKKSLVTVFLDDIEALSFTADSPGGRYTELNAAADEVAFGDIKIRDNETGQILFTDDFSENSLPDYADIELGGIKCEEWIPAEIPGSVQTALIKAGKIENPYYGFNGPKQIWIDDQNWVFKKRFQIPDRMKGKNLRLVFDGVDYRAHFWLNGKKLCYHEGFFGGPDADITDLADYGNENELVVCIQPHPTPPHSNVRPFILHRWHFNMDIVPLGIWRKIHLVANDKIFLSDPQVITKKLNDDTAIVQVGVSLGNMAMWPFDARGKITLRSPDKDDPPVSGSFAPGFFQGCFRINCTLEVPKPRLWWPNGMGDQNLYDVDIVVDIFESRSGSDPTGHDELHFKTGIRTLRMEGAPSAHQPEYPEPAVKTGQPGLYNWRFTVNGRSFFGKGSNWMPVDQMLSLPRERYELLLGRAKECNINILRPWGAGLLETDDFYEICDEFGICVWQEFPFANGFYDKSDRQLWRDTIRTNVIRLRNHPSLVMWCGGNEFDPDCTENREIIDEIEGICSEFDPAREFHRASPYGGDSHSYAVNWMGGQDYSHYTEDISVAITEYSMASPPSMDTLKKLIPGDELSRWPPDRPDNIDRYGYSKWGENVNRRESNFSIHDAHLSSITNVMVPAMSDCGIPKNWEEFVRYMQTAHGLLTQFGIDCWRSRWPDCTLTMSWVFNVIFPDTFSWSYVDYFGIPKRPYFYKKRSFEPLHVGAVFEHLFNPPGELFRAKLFIANEKLEKINNAAVKLRLYDCGLELLESFEKPCTVQADSVTSCGYFQWKVPRDMNDGVLFLCVDLIAPDGTLLSRSQYCPRVGSSEGRMPYLEKGPWIADVQNIATELKASLLKKEGSEGAGHLWIKVENTGPHPAFQVSLGMPGNEEFVTYSDNYFWLEPGETREVEIRDRKGGTKEVEIYAWNAVRQALAVNAATGAHGILSTKEVDLGLKNSISVETGES
jgi:beta-mannosidase